MFTPQHRTIATLIAAVGLAGGAAHAQKSPPRGAGNDYCVIHNFRLTTPGNITPIVRMIYDDHVRSRTNTCNDLVPGPKDNTGIDAVAPFNQFAMSTAPDSTGRANSIATITAIGPGIVTGSFEASGNASPALTGCPNPPPRRSFGRVKAWSSTMVQAHGRKMDKTGRITMRGTWNSTETISGSTYRTVGRDPIVARLIDRTTGITTEYELLSIKWAVGGGSFGWDGASISNAAQNLDLSINMTSPVTVQQGTLKLQVRNGFVTQSSGTGEFAALALPAVGTGGGFSIALPEITMDYDLGGDDTHDLETEFDFDNAGEVEKIIESDGQEAIGGCVLTDLGTGPDGSNVSEITLPDTTMGYNSTMTFGRLATRLDIPQSATVPIELVALSLTSHGAAPNAAFARVWRGFPGQGVLVAGDLSTNRLLAVESADAYRVPAHNPRDPSRPLSDVYIDLAWVPPLPPGQYWIEFATRGQTVSAQTFAIQSPWETSEQSSMEYIAQLNQWRPTMDQGSGRLTRLATHVFTAPQGQTPCYANCDGSTGNPLVTANDFQCFLDRFASGDPYANCDGSTGNPSLTSNDFQCFLNRAAAGCH